MVRDSPQQRLQSLLEYLHLRFKYLLPVVLPSVNEQEPLDSCIVFFVFVNLSTLLSNYSKILIMETWIFVFVFVCNLFMALSSFSLMPGCQIILSASVQI